MNSLATLGTVGLFRLDVELAIEVFRRGGGGGAVRFLVDDDLPRSGMEVVGLTGLERGSVTYFTGSALAISWSGIE